MLQTESGPHRHRQMRELGTLLVDGWRILGCVTALAVAQPALACGWWGDGESDELLHALIVRADGKTVDEDDGRESPESMVRIGDRLRTGSGGLRDLPRAVDWYRAAAQRGFAPGQYQLAMMYEQGLGVATNYTQAARWYRRAADQGEVHAQHHLARLYQHGRGVPLDPAKAAHWFLRAAEQGHTHVFATVAELYWEGRGVPRDELLARVWWRLAAEHGHGAIVGDMRAARAQLRPEDEARVQNLVDEWQGKWH